MSRPDEQMVYDKAKYHYEGDYPQDLDEDQAYVHTGMYLGWIIERGLHSETFAKETAELLEKFRAREVPPTEPYKYWAGVLVEHMLSDEGNAFSLDYYETEEYFSDYEDLFLGTVPSIYHVDDSWETYDKVAARLDERYDQWTKERKGARASSE